MSNKTAFIYSKHPLVQEWVTHSLKELGWEVNSSNKDKNIKFDVAIVEINTESDTLLLEQIDSPIVIFSCLAETKLISLLFDFEVNGIIRVSSNLENIKETMDAAAKGEEYYDEIMITFLLSEKYRKIHERIISLSNREQQIIEGILSDLTNDQIAEKFNLSVRTVNAHKRNILQKMQERSFVGVIKTMLTYTLRYS